MSQLYGRKVNLSVDNDAGGNEGQTTTYDLSELHIQFQVFGATVSTFKYATITVWNLSKEKANKILKEFTGITLSAGYKDGPFGQIFTGQIARVEAGKENAVDSYVRIFAQDGDEAKNWTFTSATLAAGWTDNDVYNQLMTDFKGAGLQAGFLDPGPMQSSKGARATTLIGRTGELFNELANRRGCDWFIEDGKVNLLQKGQALPGAQEVLTSQSGLIGVPKLTIQGVTARCLLNPNIRNGCVVRIDNAQIAQLSQQTVFQKEANVVIPELQGKGIYKAHCVTHSGDTRGQEWYTDMIGVSIDTTLPPAGPAFYDTPDAL